jgi:hypothetical protein
MTDFNNDYDFKAEDIINARERFSVPKGVEPPVDEVVSKIVGRKIYLQDPRLLRLVVKWKRDKRPESMEADNFLSDPKKIEELRQVLNQDL